MEIYLEKEINNLWFKKNTTIFIIRKNEIYNLINFLKHNEIKGLKDIIEDFSDLGNLEFDENDILLDLEEKEDLKSFENALYGESNKDGFLIKDPYIKQITEYQAQQYIKNLILEIY